MKLTLSLILILFISELVFYQDYSLGNRMVKIPDSWELISISSKDNSKIYRLKGRAPSTVFSYTVDKFEIIIHNNTIVTLHYVLFPKDSGTSVPIDLINGVIRRGGEKPIIKDSRYYWSDNTSRTVIYRAKNQAYGGDRIFIQVVWADYLYR